MRAAHGDSSAIWILRFIVVFPGRLGLLVVKTLVLCSSVLGDCLLALRLPALLFGGLLGSEQRFLFSGVPACPGLEVRELVEDAK